MRERTTGTEKGERRVKTGAERWKREEITETRKFEPRQEREKAEDRV